MTTSTNQPPTWCTCTTGGINPTCSHHAWQLPKKLAPPRMDAMIAEARSPDHDCRCPYLKPLADALEAAQAQVARLATIAAAAQTFFASDSWCVGLRDHVSAKACPCGYAQLRAAFEPAAPVEDA